MTRSAPALEKTKVNGSTRVMPRVMEPLEESISAAAEKMNGVHHGQNDGFTASRLRQMGLYPFPLKDHNPADEREFKRPLFVGWQNEAKRATPDELASADRSGCNLGLHLGPSRLVVIDTDTPEAEAWAAEHLPPTPWRTRTAAFCIGTIDCPMG